MKKTRFSIFAPLSLAACLLICAGCQGTETDIPEDPFALPPPALTERAQRDSSRVAQLVVSYFGYLNRGDTRKALQLFFPDSIPVAKAEGGILVEGRSAEATVEIDMDRQLDPFVRIDLLRRAEREMLEETFREIWLLHFTVADADSSRLERRIHIIQQMGSDTRFLGRMLPDTHKTE
jgi:hypothetical protein